MNIYDVLHSLIDRSGVSDESQLRTLHDAVTGQQQGFSSAEDYRKALQDHSKQAQDSGQPMTTLPTGDSTIQGGPGPAAQEAAQPSTLGGPAGSTGAAGPQVAQQAMPGPAGGGPGGLGPQAPAGTTDTRDQRIADQDREIADLRAQLTQQQQQRAQQGPTAQRPAPPAFGPQG